MVEDTRGEAIKAQTTPVGVSAWDVVLAELARLSGFEKGVLYDVPRAAAPRRMHGSSIYLQASPEWRQYLAARRRCDDGRLTPLVSLRSLSDEERLLVVDWGTAHANCFLMIEPQDAECDLTDPDADRRQELLRLADLSAERLRHEQHAFEEPAPAVAGFLRETYGVWTFWTWSPRERRAHRLRLPLAPGQTFASELLPRLRVLYPQESFDHSMVVLHEHEPELFGGSVTRARMPFRTRLGLPVLYDPRCADRAIRRLVNAGNAHAYWYSANDVARYGPGRPIPETMSEEEFERLRM